MDETCKPRITAHCEGETIVEAKEAGSCPVWDTCLPFGGHLYSDGGCVHFEPGTPPPDGTYGTIKIVDGCIADLGPVRPPLYTEANCVDVPAGCAGGGSGSGSCSVSTQAGNMLDTDASGNLLVKLYTEASDSIAFSGDGTADSPLKASTLAGAAATKVTATSPILSSFKDNKYDISHKKGFAGSVNGMQFDSWGHLVSYSEPGESVNSPITAIFGDEIGISAKADTPSKGMYTISLLPVNGGATAAHETQLGAYKVSTDTFGRFIGAERNILCPAAEFQFGEYLVTVNQYGSITDIRKADPDPDPDADPTATTGSGFARMFPRDVNTQTYTIKPSKSTGFLLCLEGGLTSATRVQFSIDGVPHDGVYLNGGKVVYVTEGVYAGGVEHTIEVFSTAGQAQGVPIVETGNALFTCMFVTV